MHHSDFLSFDFCSRGKARGVLEFFFFAPPLERNKTSDSRFSLLSLSFFPLFLITQTQQKNSGILYFKIEKHL